jgi:hypothetical protein
MPPPAPDISRWTIVFIDALPIPGLKMAYGYLCTAMQQGAAHFPGLQVEIWHDHTNSISRAFGVTGFPVFLALLDGIPMGKYHYVHLTEAIAVRWIASILGPTAAPPTP